MSEQQKCSSCKKTLELEEFTKDDKIFKTCNICRQARNDKRRKNICEDCGIGASFNFENETYAIKCKAHKDIGMVDVKNPKCVKCKKKRPSFNYEGEDKALYCKVCADDDMVNIKSPKCITCKTKVPTFNFVGEIKELYCKDCAEPGMVDIRSPKCITCKKKSPSFNIEGENKALYCKDCADEDMVDVLHIKCVTCKKKRPSFNYEGEDKALYCKDCADDDMVNIQSPKCNDCESRASFGYINQNKSHCARHKLSLMFKKTKPCCQFENCKKIAEYGITEPIHCFQHFLPTELCLLGQKCKECLRENELCNLDGICLTYCKPVEIDINIKKIIKKKEALVLSYLDKNINYHIKPIDDRVIDTSCVKNRPDRIYDCGTHFIDIEIDEHQHKNYTNGCSYDLKTQELRRMIQIHEAVSKGLIPVIFIRFNPDNFKTKNKIQKVNMQKRLEILEKWVKKCMSIDISKFKQGILIKHLFYDDYDETDIKFETIDDNTLIELIN